MLSVIMEYVVAELVMMPDMDNAGTGLNHSMSTKTNGRIEK